MVCAYQVVLTDIEGTTTPISFVKDVLFPYVLENLDAFLTAKWEEPELQPYINDLVEHSRVDFEDGVEDSVLIQPGDKASLMQNIRWQMSIDRKQKALKALQGYMWRGGYAKGDLKGIVYDDVVTFLKSCETRNVPVYIYSSGSVAAQKLLFGYSDHGDLLHLFKGHFDTNVGSKLEEKSYRRIAEEIGYQPDQILFLSDNPREVEAATKAGMQVCILVRPGNAPLSEKDTSDYPVIHSFADIQ